MPPPAKGRGTPPRAESNDAKSTDTESGDVGNSDTDTARLRASARRLLGMLRPERTLCAYVLALALLSVGLAAAGPWLLGQATDVVVSGVVPDTVPGRVAGAGAAAGPGAGAAGADTSAGAAGAGANAGAAAGGHPHGVDFGALRTWLLWALLAYCGAALAGAAQARLMTVIVGRLVFRVRGEVGAKLHRLALGRLDARPRGEVLSRATNDVDTIGQSLQQALGRLTDSVLTAVVIFGVMAWLSPLLTLITLVTMPLSILAAARLGRRAQPEFIAQRAATGDLNAHIEEVYEGLEVIRGFGREQEAAAAFDRANDALGRTTYRAHLLSGLIAPVMAFLGNAGFVLIAAAGGLLAAGGALSVGQVQAFLVYSRGFSQPVAQIAAVSALVQAGLAAAARVFELLDEEEERPDPAAPVRPVRPAGHLVLERVSFAYPGGPPVIEDLSLTVRPGHTAAIVGATGAGKTTLAGLLMRFHDADRGRVLLDGTDLTAMTRPAVRAAIGLVPQDGWLFTGTIEENIGYGAAAPSASEIRRAAEAACADPFIRGLPHGYDTVVGAGGVRLSAGERQLIAIARALVARPAVLVLDEATSQVDSRTEMLIRRAVGRLRSGRTCVVIAHRLATIRHADEIVVMEHGRIVERGSHEALLAAAGAYARLHDAQNRVSRSASR